jgi:hypothetical protein
MYVVIHLRSQGVSSGRSGQRRRERQVTRAGSTTIVPPAQ